jgi:hypothetical protein
MYARSVDLPGFDDNVSPSNTINMLLRFVIGEYLVPTIFLFRLVRITIVV